MCRLLKTIQMPSETIMKRVNLIKEICSIKGVWLERFAEKIDHHFGSEKVIVDTVNQMMTNMKIDSK